MGEMPILRLAAQVIAEVEERVAAEEREAAQAFATLMERTLAAHRRGRSITVEVPADHLHVATRMLDAAGYKYRKVPRHQLDAQHVVEIEVSLLGEGREAAVLLESSPAKAAEVSLSDGREPWATPGRRGGA